MPLLICNRHDVLSLVDRIADEGGKVLVIQMMLRKRKALYCMLQLKYALNMFYI